MSDHEELLKQILQSIQLKPNISYEGKTYVADWDESKSYDAYSKAWHRMYGPQIMISDRRVYVIDHATLSCKLITRLTKWPPAPRTIEFRHRKATISDGPYRAIVDRLPKEDLPLLIGSQGPAVEPLIERRLKKGF